MLINLDSVHGIGRCRIKAVIRLCRWACHVFSTRLNGELVYKNCCDFHTLSLRLRTHTLVFEWPLLYHGCTDPVNVSLSSSGENGAVPPQRIELTTPRIPYYQGRQLEECLRIVVLYPQLSVARQHTKLQVLQS